MTRYQYDRQGLLALDPKAFLGFFVEAPNRDNIMRGDAVVVRVQGPLEHHSGWFCDSYDELLERVDAACETNAKRIILSIDSPGGQVSGMIETARAIQAKAKSAGKRLIAYVDGSACSAAYALACAADEIVVPATGLVGSIGVIHTRVDLSEADKAVGVKVALVTSGARKSDGHPNAPITDSELAATQALVDSLAQVFFELVAERRKKTIAEIAALEAGVFDGRKAAQIGLADRVQSFDELLASLASAEEVAMDEFEKARAALEEIAKGDGEEAERARRALAAMDGEESEEKTEEKKDDEEKEDESEKVSATTAAQLGATVSSLSARLARLEREKEEAERTALLASRPDLGKDLIELLITKPLAEVKSIVSAIPRPLAPNLANTSVLQGTRGATQGTAVSPEFDAIDVRMGVKATRSIGVVHSDTQTVLGAPRAIEKNGV